MRRCERGINTKKGLQQNTEVLQQPLKFGGRQRTRTVDLLGVKLAVSSVKWGLRHLNVTLGQKMIRV